jgi:tRNA(Glu) U13 pseudouridine synthase TruD
VLRIPLAATCQVDGDTARLGFTLPPGSYATIVLRELLKNE